MHTCMQIYLNIYLYLSLSITIPLTLTLTLSLSLPLSDTYARIRRHIHLCLYIQLCIHTLRVWVHLLFLFCLPAPSAHTLTSSFPAPASCFKNALLRLVGYLQRLRWIKSSFKSICVCKCKYTCICICMFLQVYLYNYVCICFVYIHISDCKQCLDFLFGSFTSARNRYKVVAPSFTELCQLFWVDIPCQ